MENNTSGVKAAKAGLGKRFVAWFLDALLIAIVFSVIAFGLGALLGLGTQSENAGLAVLVDLIVAFVGLVAYFVYHTVMEAVYGYTLGKLAMDIVVTTESGEPVSWGGSIIRNAVRIIGRFLFPFSWLLAVFLIVVSDEQQRLGDMVASTYVVKA